MSSPLVRSGSLQGYVCAGADQLEPEWKSSPWLYIRTSMWTVLQERLTIWRRKGYGLSGSVSKSTPFTQWKATSRGAHSSTTAVCMCPLSAASPECCPREAKPCCISSEPCTVAPPQLTGISSVVSTSQMWDVPGRAWLSPCTRHRLALGFLQRSHLHLSVLPALGDQGVL